MKKKVSRITELYNCIYPYMLIAEDICSFNVSQFQVSTPVHIHNETSTTVPPWHQHWRPMSEPSPWHRPSQETKHAEKHGMRYKEKTVRLIKVTWKWAQILTKQTRTSYGSMLAVDLKNTSKHEFSTTMDQTSSSFQKQGGEQERYQVLIKNLSCYI
jgi:hypothetical protein